MMQPHPGTANTLLHSFMYHERAMTEGCASPNPAPMMRKLQSPYYNIVSIKFVKKNNSKDTNLRKLIKKIRIRRTSSIFQRKIMRVRNQIQMILIN